MILLKTLITELELYFRDASLYFPQGNDFPMEFLRKMAFLRYSLGRRAFLKKSPKEVIS